MSYYGFKHVFRHMISQSKTLKKLVLDENDFGPCNQNFVYALRAMEQGKSL